ncbi:site-2 protease family protein [Luteimonas terrae]|uniref:Membrane-associated protease RseP (Regulator of RpoE activity) n=1 Tax=Luteimonas terrae TaxID=1530191 RepID=A0ABU1XRJ8_9GAMM|nr:site-2 protease family protein [Luteimonas terrae]MDR7191386.1 membrane-associated protease RseP (regulator of RpoE activity) [Luteimonas terrae]
MSFIFVALLAAALFTPMHVLAMALVSRLFGIGVEEISLGIGPPLLRRGRLVLKLLLPFGGYCRFRTADSPDESVDGELPTGKRFDAQPGVVRAVVALSGPLALLALA